MPTSHRETSFDEAIGIEALLSEGNLGEFLKDIVSDGCAATGMSRYHRCIPL